jgi:hypothetical protein
MPWEERKILAGLFQENARKGLSARGRAMGTILSFGNVQLYRASTPRRAATTGPGARGKVDKRYGAQP